MTDPRYSLRWSLSRPNLELVLGVTLWDGITENNSNIAVGAERGTMPVGLPIRTGSVVQATNKLIIEPTKSGLLQDELQDQAWQLHQ